MVFDERPDDKREREVKERLNEVPPVTVFDEGDKGMKKRPFIEKYYDKINCKSFTDETFDYLNGKQFLAVKNKKNASEFKKAAYDLKNYDVKKLT